MDSNEIGGITWGIIVASWVSKHYGTDSDAFITMCVIAMVVMMVTIGYNWGKYIRKKRMGG